MEWWTLSLLIIALIAVAAILVGYPPVRQRVLSWPIFQLLQAFKLMPNMSPTEREALAAGTVSIEAELFRGQPNFRKLFVAPLGQLSQKEQAFIDGPVTQLCAITDDWKAHQDGDFPEEVWNFLHSHGFFGLTIPTDWDGHGFSATAFSAICVKLASRSVSLCITVMVPNSLGPAELILHYGTDAQKQQYLYDLANGKLIPAFALTEQGAGSDAASLKARAMVVRDESGNLALRINWKKRYITMAPIADLIAIAVRVYDPARLLNRNLEGGLTVVLIPGNTRGVQRGRRHDPLGVPFLVGPIDGVDVLVPITNVLGGEEKIGQGWRMLMEVLAAGRGVAMPACLLGAAKLATRVAGNHARIRHQFGQPLGNFEGIQEPLARLIGLDYAMDAMRRLVATEVDAGAHSPVLSSIAKYHSTEYARKMLADAMDIVAGQGVCSGPRNLLAALHLAIPVGITVEGANILTRTFMLYGQGALRCHPYLLQIFHAFEKKNMLDFDRALWSHIGWTLKNAVHFAWTELTRGYTAGGTLRHPLGDRLRRLARISACFAFVSDIVIALHTGSLKRRESLTGRLADALSWMVISVAVARRFESEGRQRAFMPLAQWSLDYASERVQEALTGTVGNLRGVGWVLRATLGVWLRLFPFGQQPKDTLGQEVAKTILAPGPIREAMSLAIFTPRSMSPEPLAQQERAFSLLSENQALFRKLRAFAARTDVAADTSLRNQIALALKAGVISEHEAELINRTDMSVAEALHVDDFEAAKVDRHPPAPTRAGATAYPQEAVEEEVKEEVKDEVPQPSPM